MPPEPLGSVLWNPDAAALGAHNALICETGRKQLEPFAGPLSVKHMLRGFAHWRADGRRFRVEGDAFLVLNHGTVYSLERAAEEPSRSFCAFFARGFVEQAQRALVAGERALLDEPDASPGSEHRTREQLYTGTERVATLLRALARAIALHEVTPLGAEVAFAELARALVRLDAEVAHQVARLPARRSATRAELYARVQRGRELMHDRFAAPLRLAEIARAACLSPHHFQRSFRAVHRESPQRYLTRLRLERARRLLRESERSVTEICAAVGFESLGTFSALFRRASGLSPSAYRREIRKIGEAGASASALGWRT